MKIKLDFKSDDVEVRINHPDSTAEFATGTAESLTDAAAVLAGFAMPAGRVDYFVLAIARGAVIAQPGAETVIER